MFTQLVMISTIVLLLLVGIKTFQQSQKLKSVHGRILSFGLFLISAGILMYALRDIFVQLGMYEIQETILLIGSVFHILGSILLFWFVCSFAEEGLRKLSFGIGLVLIILLIIGISTVYLDSEIVQAPFEPFSYTIIRNFFHEPEALSALFLWTFLVFPLLILGITLYHVLKLKEKNLKKKGLFYGLGFMFLIFPMLVCMFISPIYARWGYLIGAILIYKALGMKV